MDKYIVQFDVKAIPFLVTWSVYAKNEKEAEAQARLELEILGMKNINKSILFACIKHTLEV